MNRNMNKFLVLFFTIIFSGCAGKKQISVTNLNQQPEVEPGSFLYSLPKTTLKLYVEVSHDIFKAGPYATYAEKYLNLKDVLMDDNESWKITNAFIEAIHEADPGQNFMVSGDLKSINIEKLFEFTPEGFVFSKFPITVEPDETVFHPLPGTDLKESVLYKDLSVKRNFYEETDTLYKTLFKDSVFIKIPLLRKQLAAKNIEEKAEEAANFLIKTRKRRFKLVSGQYDFIPKGNTLEVSIKELNRLEEEYLSLFIGKNFTGKKYHVFYFTPENNSEKSKNVIFRFSGEEGLVDRTSSKGEPVFLEIHRTGDVFQTNQFYNLQLKNKQKNYLVYRVAQKAVVRLIKGTSPITTGRMNIYQYGNLLTMPLDLLNQE